MLCLFAVFAFSCNEEMERLLTDDYPESGTEYTTGHVLMVVIDGASGIAVNEAYLCLLFTDLPTMKKG